MAEETVAALDHVDEYLKLAQRSFSDYRASSNYQQLDNVETCLLLNYKMRADVTIAVCSEL